MKQVLNCIWLPIKNERTVKAEAEILTRAQGIVPTPTLSEATGVPWNVYDPSLPQAYLKNALVTAHENPEVQVILWLDYDRMLPENIARIQDFINSYREEHKIKNTVEIKNLRSLDKYKTTDLFNTDTSAYDAENNRLSAPIWLQSDWARIMVLQHSFTHLGAEQAFYSDGDILNLNVLDEAGAIQGILQKHGQVYCNNGQLENGFMGFKSDKLPFLNTLSRVTEEAATTAIHKENGWVVLARMLLGQRTWGQMMRNEDVDYLSLPYRFKMIPPSEARAGWTR